MTDPMELARLTAYPPDLTPEQHAEVLNRILENIDAVESVAALLVEAKRTMIEASFLLASPCEVPPDTIFSRVSEAIAVLEAGVVLIDGAIGAGGDE